MDLSRPLINLHMRVTITTTLKTDLIMDSLSSTGQPAITLCSIPQTTFTVIPKCGDSLLQKHLAKIPLTFFTVHPNPVTDHEFTVSYSLAQDDLVTMEMIDERGQTTTIENRQFEKRGEHQLVMNTLLWPKGLHYLRLATSNGVSVTTSVIELR